VSAISPLAFAGLDRQAADELLQDLDVHQPREIEILTRWLLRHASESNHRSRSVAPRRVTDSALLLAAAKRLFEFDPRFLRLTGKERTAFRRLDPVGNLADAVALSRAVKQAALKHLQEATGRILQVGGGSADAADTLEILLALVAAESRSGTSDIPRLTVAIYHLAAEAEDRRARARGKQGGPAAHGDQTRQARTAALLAFVRHELPKVRQTHGRGPATKLLRALIARWNARKDVKKQGWSYTASVPSLAKLCQRNGIAL
jgi:hypothetical protein